MYEIQFSKKSEIIGRFYVWSCDLEKVKKHIQEYGHEIIKTNKYNFFKGFYYAYIKEPQRRYKKGGDNNEGEIRPLFLKKFVKNFTDRCPGAAAL